MQNKKLQPVILRYYNRYRKNIKGLRFEDVGEFVQRKTKEASAVYSNLPDPIISNPNVYIEVYVEKSLAKHLSQKSIKPINLDNPPKEFRAQADFFNNFPPEILIELRNRLYDTPLKDRARVWKKFELPVDVLEKKFKKVVRSRIEIARSKGKEQYVDLLLEKYEIPEKEYDYFIKNIDATIAYCNQNLPKGGGFPKEFFSKFNLPCFICRLSEFPFQSNKDVIDYFAAEFDLVLKFKDKIVIETGDYSKMSYRVKTDDFLVTLAKRANRRHRGMDLVHELSHVVWYLQMLSSGKNPYDFGQYEREKQATKIELQVLKKLSPMIYSAQMAEILLTIQKVLFELNLYANPDQDLSKLYARTFNQVFDRQPGQKSNELYLIDEKIIMEPFSNLPHAVAAVNLLTS